MSPVLKMCPRHHSTHPGRCPHCEAERRGRLKAHTSPQGRAFRLAILNRDGWRCHWCSAQADTVDYVVALVDGGAAHDMGNAVAACRSCNSKRGAALTNGVGRGRGSDRNTLGGYEHPATFPRVKLADDAT